MDGNTRRKQIISELKQAGKPVSGRTLAARTGVSRQVIVQDIALLRTEYPILATAQGYLLYSADGHHCARAYLVRHSREQIRDELSTIVALGGVVLDVIVEHDVYGQLRADLNLGTQPEVDSFCTRLENSASGPLFPISQGIHLHTVRASSEEILDRIGRALRDKGYLLK